MLKYSCSTVKLVNWVLYQLNDQPGMVFPRKKGWTANIKLFYPGDGRIPYYLVLIANDKELLVFIPVTRHSDKSHIKTLTGRKLIKEIRGEKGQGIDSVQTIFMTSEKDEEKVSDLLLSFSNEVNVLKLDYEAMSFTRGNFINPRLEFRLTSQELDPDLIPNLVPETPREGMGWNSVSLFYQNLFSYMNRCWFSGNWQFYLRSALKDLIPYWNQYRKKDQQETLKRVQADLDSVFEQFGFEGFLLINSPKKADLRFNSQVRLPEKPANKKEMNHWLRKQEQALRFLRDEGKQISIDVLNLDVQTGF